MISSRLWAYNSASSSVIAERFKPRAEAANIPARLDKQFQRLTWYLVSCTSISGLNCGCVREIKILLDLR
jgi:hypothetical protein